MDTTDPRDPEVIAAERKADQMREASAKRQMPADPSLGSDASFLRELGITAGQFLKEVMLGEREATPEQMSAAKTLMPLEHRMQPTKVQSEVTGDADVMLLVDAIRAAHLNNAEVVALKATYQAERHALGITKH